MGPEGFEPTTTRLWAGCSNQTELRALSIPLTNTLDIKTTPTGNNYKHAAFLVEVPCSGGVDRSSIPAFRAGDPGFKSRPEHLIKL